MLFNQCFTFKPANITLYQRLLFVTLILSVLSPWGQCTPIVCDAGQTVAQRLVFAETCLFTLCFENEGHGIYLPSAGIFLGISKTPSTPSTLDLI